MMKITLNLKNVRYRVTHVEELDFFKSCLDGLGWYNDMQTLTESIIDTKLKRLQTFDEKCVSGDINSMEKDYES